MVILGIDPGSRHTGYGLIQQNKNKVNYLTSGFINANEQSIDARLAQIFNGIQYLVKQYQPQVLAIEKAFLAKNPHVAIILGQARGAAIVAASIHKISVFEYAPRYIKKAVVGTGTASKEQVQHMVRILLNLSALPQTDAADALAVAICHSNLHPYQNLNTTILDAKDV